MGFDDPLTELTGWRGKIKLHPVLLRQVGRLRTVVYCTDEELPSIVSVPPLVQSQVGTRHRP